MALLNVEPKGQPLNCLLNDLEDLTEVQSFFSIGPQQIFLVHIDEDGVPTAPNDDLPVNGIRTRGFNKNFVIRQGWYVVFQNDMFKVMSPDDFVNEYREV